MDKSSLSGFTQFPNLPLELRLQIWKLTIVPRLVFCHESISLNPPTILHVCKESRNEGLLHYQLLQGHIADSDWYTYFNLELDTLFSTSISINSSWSMGIGNNLKGYQYIEQIRHLAVSGKLWDRIAAFPVYFFLYDRMRRSKCLETLTIVEYEYRGAAPYAKRLSKAARLVEYTTGAEQDLEKWGTDLLESREEFPEWNCPVLKLAKLEWVMEPLPSTS